MPKGVEHFRMVEIRPSLSLAKGSVMPKGVEHIAIQTGFYDNAGRKDQ